MGRMAAITPCAAVAHCIVLALWIGARCGRDVTPLLGMSDLPGGFIAAVMRNDTDLVTKMLDKEPMLLNAKAGYYETTALMAAADEGYLEVCPNGVR